MPNVAKCCKTLHFLYKTYTKPHQNVAKLIQNVAFFCRPQSNHRFHRLTRIFLDADGHPASLKTTPRQADFLVLTGTENGVKLAERQRRPVFVFELRRGLRYATRSIAGLEISISEVDAWFMRDGSQNNQYKQAEQLFAADVDWWMNACLDPFNENWYPYLNGYMRGAKVLVEHVRNNRIDLDSLVFPIVFLYRQYIELQLKCIIGNGRRFLGKQGGYPKNHKLDELWSEARSILEKVYEGDPKEELDEIESQIKQFCDRDAFGDAFRYPTNVKGDKSLPGLMHINVRKFSEAINKAADLLDGVSMGIDERLAWQLEMESEYGGSY